jgi:hypothetical protein
MASPFANSAKPIDKEAAATIKISINPTIKGAPQFSLTYPLILAGISLAKLLIILQTLPQFVFSKEHAQDLMLVSHSESEGLR